MKPTLTAMLVTCASPGLGTTRPAHESPAVVRTWSLSHPCTILDPSPNASPTFTPQQTPLGPPTTPQHVPPGHLTERNHAGHPRTETRCLFCTGYVTVHCRSPGSVITNKLYRQQRDKPRVARRVAKERMGTLVYSLAFNARANSKHLAVRSARSKSRRLATRSRLDRSRISGGLL
jgi:hypothetical protein